MTLVSRVSTFFLTALAVILLGNSLLLYVVASRYLHERFEEQLESALQTLVAAVEVEDDDVKWEPSDHTVMIGMQRGGDEIRWVVLGDEDRVLDQSRDLSPGDREVLMATRLHSGRDPSNWRYLQQKLTAIHPKKASERSLLEQSQVTIIVARNKASLLGVVRTLGLALIVLPSICWLIAAALGRRFCERALLPVRSMAQNLRMIRAEDTHARLPILETNDELQELATSFNKLLDAVFIAYERQRQFAGDAAHQLRTPLTVLQGQIEVALRRRRPEEEYRQTLSIAQDEVLRLSATVETLLRLARPDAESPISGMLEVDLHDWLDEYMSKWKDHARGADIRHRCQPQLCCRTRPELLEQILEILLANAVKYSPAGSAINVVGIQEGSCCLLEVVDRGPGIAVEDQAAVFEPFFRTRSARQSGAPGIGLGLALARRIAVSLNARLECVSQPGCETRFRLRLPS